MSLEAILRTRRATAANWTSDNPALEDGELGIETDTLKMKLGDGSTAWNSLGYLYGVALAHAAATVLDSTTIDFSLSGQEITGSVKDNSLVAGKLTATATDKIFGRSSSGAGAGEEIACTAAGRAILDDADAAAQRTTLSAAAISHASTHGPSGSSALKLDDLEVPDDNTDLDASTAKHGLMPKAVNDATKFYCSDGTQARPNGRSLFINTADSSTVSGTASETTFDVTYTITAGDMNSVGRAIRVRASGRETGISLSTMQLRVKLGSTTVFNLSALTLGVSTDSPWMIDVTLVCRATGASGSVHVAAVAQAVAGRFGTGPGTTTTIDWTAAQAIGISVQFNSAGANSAKLETLDVQAVNF